MAVEEMVRNLSLNNVSTLVARAEDLPSMGYAHSFDLILARAVAPLADLMKWSRPLLAPKRLRGDENSSARMLPTPCLVAYKGGNLSHEMSLAQRRFPDAGLRTFDINFPNDDAIPLEQKQLVVVTFPDTNR
jgi:16S rRNA (guanine527-N7)-methyltransferase